MNLNVYFEQLFTILNNRDNHLIIMASYLGLTLLIMLLRVVVCMTYRSALFAFHQGAKEIKARDEINKIRNGLLRKIAADYIRIADKSVSRIPTTAVVDRHVSAFSLLGWRYVSIMPFVEAMEVGLVLVGLVLAVVFNDFAAMYGVLAVSGFVLTRLVAAFFDFKAAKTLLSDELLIFVEREIGRFYAADAGGAVLRLKDELAGAVAKQSEVLKEAIGQIGTALSEAMEKNMDKKLIDMNDLINKTTRQTVQDWEKALSEAGRVQALTNASAEKMQAAGENILSAADLLSKYMQGHANAMSGQLNALVSAVEAFTAEQDSFLKQARYVERNQTLLEGTLQSFEETLQNVTRSLGDGLGAYLQLHAQTASQTVNDALSANMDKIIGNDQEMIARLQRLFEQLNDQSKDISANLRSMHEKLAVHSDG